MINSILLDLDGILRHWDSRNDTKIETAVGLPRGAIRQVAFSPDLLVPAIKGLCSDEEWRLQIIARLHVRFPGVDSQKAVHLWSEPAGEVDTEVLGTIRTCRQKARVTLVTNATSRLPYDLERLGLTLEFDQVINSSSIGWAKPQPEIYWTAIRIVGVPVDETLYIDDTSSYVEIATQQGMFGHVYRGPSALNRELVAYGLL